MNSYELLKAVILDIKAELHLIGEMHRPEERREWGALHFEDPKVLAALKTLNYLIAQELNGRGVPKREEIAKLGNGVPVVADEVIVFLRNLQKKMDGVSQVRTYH